MQKDLNEMKRGLNIATTRYNHLNFRVNQLKRKLSAEVRKADKKEQERIEEEVRAERHDGRVLHLNARTTFALRTHIRGYKEQQHQNQYACHISPVA